MRLCPELWGYAGGIGVLPHQLCYPPATGIAVMVEHCQMHQAESTSLQYQQILHIDAGGTSYTQPERFGARMSLIEKRLVKIGCSL